MADNSRFEFSLGGQVALVVGGYGAIGSAISETMAKAGATTIIAGRNQDRASALAATLSRNGLKADGIAIDASSPFAIETSVSECVRRHERIDILVNCVGFNLEQPIRDVTEAAFDEVYSSNLKPALFLSKFVADRQIEAGSGGKHVHLLSLRSHFGFKGRGYSAFCAAKGGMTILVKQLSSELGPFGITVNGIAPGLVLTDKNRKALMDPERRKAAIAGIPLGRLATPADIAGAALFFSSPLCEFASGVTLVLDGGLTASF